MSEQTDFEGREAKDVEGFFNDFAANWSTLYGGQRSVVWQWLDRVFRCAIYERYRLTFETLGNNLRGQRVLDVGCGNGVYAFETVRRGADLVIGIDAASGMIDLCRTQRKEHGIEDRTCFIHSHFPPPASLKELEQEFDIGIVMGVLDYVSDPVLFLQVLRERISKFAVISFPAKDPLRWPLRRWRYRVLGRCAVFHYNESEVREVCNRAGFGELDITHIKCTGSSYFVKAYV